MLELLFLIPVAAYAARRWRLYRVPNPSLSAENAQEHVPLLPSVDELPSQGAEESLSLLVAAAAGSTTRSARLGTARSTGFERAF